MSNIHTLRDMRAASAEAGGGASSSFWGTGMNRERSTAALFGAETNEEVRCIDIFFPGFKVKSFILWISVVEIIVYIITLFVGSSELKPTGDTLSMFGSSYGPYIQKGEVWRLVTPIFLHGSIWHILFNVFFQMRMGFSIEETYGLKRMAILYFVSGIGGNLFSVATAPCKSAVGASTAGFGLIGLQMSEMALSWHLILHRDRAVFNIVMFVFISVMLSLAPGSAVDWRGHLGGFMMGFALGIPFNSTMESRPRWYKTGLYSALTGLVALYIATIVVIFAIPMEGPTGRCT